MADLSLRVFGSDDPNAGYVAWTPAPLTIVNHDNNSEFVKLTNESLTGGITRVVFMRNPSDAPLDELTVDLGGLPEVTVFVAGKFQDGQKHNGSSPDSKDVEVKAVFVSDPNVVVAQLSLMVRVRKNANELSDQAHDDFLNALAELNGIQQQTNPSSGLSPGQGVYTTDFVKMHVGGASDSEHGDSHFLPWHRLYLLDLERLLQQINPSVTLPFWKFDEAAPNVFNADFMGQMLQIPRDTSLPGGEFDQGGVNTPLATFSVNNPLSKWQIENTQGIPRTARFNPASEPAKGLSASAGQNPFDFAVLNQNGTLALGGGTTNPDDATFGQMQMFFSSMEGTPHGAAHVSFNGYINFVPIAPQDPLFFLLHCNVDRLWAVWQYAFDRSAKTDVKTYPYQSPGSIESWKVVTSTQWPWDGSDSMPGNLAPPGTRQNNFTQSPQLQDFPGHAPKIENAIDPFGYHDTLNYLGFAYDDVPYEPSPSTAPIA